MAPPSVTKHFLTKILVKDLVAKLDELALDDWSVIEVFPEVANLRELGDEGVVVCLLRRKVKP